MKAAVDPPALNEMQRGSPNRLALRFSGEWLVFMLNSVEMLAETGG